jgi:hypothetical protein
MSVGAVFGALFGGLFFGNRRIEIRTRPNQGIRRSAYNAFSIGVVSGLTLGTVAAVAFGWLPGGVFMGLLVAIPAFLVFGGAAVIKHALLRFVLIRSGDTPRNLAHFLDFAAHIGILRKVGGGTIFVHRYLLDYFAGLEAGVENE